MIDGGLRMLFQKNIPEAHWQAIETGSTGRGIPDLNFCLNGREGWIELKQTSGWAVTVRPEQVAWIERRARAGGRVFVAVRRIDWLYLCGAAAARDLASGGLKLAIAAGSVLCTFGPGPKSWDWEHIRRVLER